MEFIVKIVELEFVEKVCFLIYSFFFLYFGYVKIYMVNLNVFFCVNFVILRYFYFKFFIEIEDKIMIVFIFDL